ncbi:coiled-coil domain-containing protein 178-like [Diadema antillarum]|uniref:coiled-coil domain-containing protein 178-like n=1 Tax=Diadema antillarum TaxID=105358 RepID=UPI003A87D5CF
MSENAQRPAVKITVEDENQTETHTTSSTGKSEKPKAFITQPRTGSLISHSSENFSTGASTITGGRYQSTSLLPSKAGSLLESSVYCGRPDSGEGDSGIDEEKESPRLTRREAEDIIYPLPEGWPRLQDKIFRRRALFFRKPMPPSIAKAVEQLQLLQDRIEAWSREVELEILSRRSSVISAAGGGPPQDMSLSPRQAGAKSTRFSAAEGKVRKQLRFATASGRTESQFSTATSIQSSPTPSIGAPKGKAPSMSSYDFMVQGVGGEVSEMDSLADLEEEPVPHLGAEEVIDEVVTLLGRLETDRADTEGLFQKEKVRVEWLQGKIDRISQKRLYELPRVVQQEHQACATDIAELKWHNAYRGRQKDRIQGQVENAEMLNERLHEDIAFVEKHCPLVEEKLELERGAMKRIDEAQEQTEQELNKTIEKLKRTENKSSEAHGKADKEREHIKKELESVRETLEEINHELEAAKVLHSTYTSQCSDLRTKIKNAEHEKIVLETREENSRKAEKIQTTKIKQVRDQIVEAEFDHRKQADNNYQLNNKTETLRKEHKSLVTRLEKECKENLAALRHREQGCREMIMTIEDIESKIRHCKKQKVSDAKNMERIKREMAKVKTQLGVVDDEYQKIKVINVAVRNKLTGEEDKARAMEDSLQNTVDSLKKQLKEETHNRTVLQARIMADSTDLAKRQVEAKKKKAKVMAKALEVDEIVAKVLTETKKLRARRAEKQQAINKINQGMEDLKTEEEELRADHFKKKAELEPKLKHLLAEILNKQRRLDHMAYRTDLINKKLAEMAQSEGFMNRVIKNTSEEIQEMSADVEEMTIQLETGQKQQRELQVSLDEVTGRIGKRDTGHLEHMAARREVLEQHLAELRDALKQNKELAHEYRELQQHYFQIKEESVNLLERRTGLEASLKDHRQLNSLQIRLHHALAHYFFIRGLFNQNELARFEDMSAENENRIGELQQEMDAAIQTISLFLNEQVDGTATRMVTAAASTALMEDIEKSGTAAESTGRPLVTGSAQAKATPVIPPIIRAPEAIKTN